MPRLEQSSGVGACGIAIRGHHHALAGRQQVVFHHPGRVPRRRPEPIQSRVQTRWAVDDFTGGGAHAGRRHDVLGECFGAFDAGRVLAGPEADDAGIAHSVGHAEDQRHFGADHDQVRPHLAGQCDDLVAGGDVDAVLLGDPAGPRVAGSDD
jgi:hypothetical protein